MHIRHISAQNTALRCSRTSMYAKASGSILNRTVLTYAGSRSVA